MEKNREKLFQVKERRGTNSTKWDSLMETFGCGDILPMWVADMDYTCPIQVQEALRKYVDDDVYGYYKVPDGYYEAFINWQKRRNDYEIKKEWIRYTPGVVAGIYWSVNVLTSPGDSCMILLPVYYPFINAILDNGRKVAGCRMKQDEKGSYYVDFNTFEECIVKNDVKAFILCSPHNPVGRVWREDELRKMFEICEKYHIYIISDEVHSDLIMPGYRHITARKKVSDPSRLVVLMGGSKTFNLAGCNCSYMIVQDEKLGKRFDQFALSCRCIRGSSFGYVALEAAFRYGEEWLEQVQASIMHNFGVLKEQLKEKLPKAKLTQLEGTYLCWIDIGEYIAPEDMEKTVTGRCKLGVDFGPWFFSRERDEPDTHIRLNIATSEKNVIEAVNRLAKINSR